MAQRKPKARKPLLEETDPATETDGSGRGIVVATKETPSTRIVESLETADNRNPGSVDAGSGQQVPPPTIATDSPYVITRTSPAELLRHDISDEELGVLGDSTKDYLWEGKWVALGGVVGAVPNAADALYRYFKNADAFTVIDLMQVIIFFVSAAVFLVLQYVVKVKSGDSTGLVDLIRKRTKSRVAG